MRREPSLNAAFIRGSGSQAYLWAMRALLIIMALSCVFGPTGDIPAQAQSDGKSTCGTQKSAKIKPLPQILATVKREVPGQILDVQLDACSAPPTYRIRVRNDKGNVLLAIVNAETGRIISTKGQR